MWKDKNDVLMISTRSLHSEAVVDTGKTNFQNESITRPQVIVDYSKGRQSTDLSEQLWSQEMNQTFREPKFIQSTFTP